MSKQESKKQESKKKEPLRCSFCNKSQTEVKKLIAGPDVFICDQCVDICCDILVEDRLAERKRDLPSVEELRAALDSQVFGQEAATGELARLVHLHWTRSADVAPPDSKNVLLAGPVGTGKTRSVRYLAKAFNIPMAVVDASRLYGGSILERLDPLEALLVSADGNSRRAERGIVVVDHLDGIAAPGGRDPESLRCQRSLLPLLEGTTVKVSSGRTIDTTGILFLGCGTFTDSLTPGKSGKSFEDGKRTRSPIPSCETLLRHGMLPELASRFGVMIRFRPLGEEELLRVLQRDEREMVRRYESLFSQEGVEVTFTEEALEAVAREAAKRQGGARSLAAILENVALDLSQHLSMTSGTTSFQVDRAFVEESSR